MISMNLISLRKKNNLTQEDVAEKIGVSRQAVAKWEKGESVPDMYNCIALAKLFDVTIDDLVQYSEKDSGMPLPPKGKHFFGSVTVGERGQIVIPKRAREIFHINPGDKVVILGDEDRGLAIAPQKTLMEFIASVSSVFKGEDQND
ncbi:MAG: helix-turn-helix transcriptional regulator [Oscillospiraceae bacterium]|nr:helix-turn-helix transcriptional regulator [Oscillospiraceae bacterium]